jgi:hypothetical protein
MAKRRSESDAVAEAKAVVESLVVSPNAAIPQAAGSARGAPAMAQGYERITERVFSLPAPDALFEGLMDELEVKEALTPQAVAQAANVCERRALDAHQLYVCARADHERYESETARVMGALREAATAELQQEKNDGKRSKAITNDDVEGRASSMFPDEWTDIVMRRAKAKGMIEHLERLASLWRYRSANMTNLRGG